MQPEDNNPATNKMNPGNNADNGQQPGTIPEDHLQERIDRLAGEQAPDITPEEFARLQRSCSLHIDSHGRVRPNRREDSDPGVSLRKRRAWYR